MSINAVCHMLIGPPGSGKSTLAHQIQSLFPESCIVSTDHIRKTLYGDETHQGQWADISAVVLYQIQQALTQGHCVIYDATNAKRAWRMALLRQLAALPVQWVGWHLTTPVATCHQWNQQRDRQVPAAVVDAHYTALQQFPPHPAEGFVAVYALTSSEPLAQVVSRLQQLDRSIINRNNRTRHRQVTFHRYSGLLDFDRLMHLLSLLVRYPGLGDLSNTDAQTLQSLLGEPAIPFANPFDEMAAVLARQQGELYGDAIAIRHDVEWLEVNGFLSPTPRMSPLIQPLPAFVPEYPHSYTDWDAFQRLLTTIRFIAHHPFCWDELAQSSLKSLVASMQQQGLLQGDRQAAIRKDFEQVLKPFGILPPFRMRRGYFLGSGILSESQLLKVASLLQTQAKNIQDPLALSLLETLRERLQRSQHDLDTLYPVRAIANRLIIDAALLPADAIARHPERLEAEIESGQLLELKRYAGVGRFDTHPDDFFLAWPLQIVFRNIAWYLGCELAAGPEKGLLIFERLDRLFRGRPQGQKRSRVAQLKALHQLQELQQACAGLYLGKSVVSQRQFLSSDEAVQAEASMLLELWFTDRIFAFISEGTQRFPQSQMKMSPKLKGRHCEPDDLFCLEKSPDAQHPNRLQVRLPLWSSDDIDLRRWILGFGAEVKVISPVVLQQQIQQIGHRIANLYSPDPGTTR